MLRFGSKPINSEAHHRASLLRPTEIPPNSWGLCRNSRSYGIRADKKEQAAVRGALRPADAALNEANRQIDPKAQWILKGSLTASHIPGTG